MYWLRNISPFLGLLVLLHCASVITPAHAHSGHPHADAARIHRMLANDARGAITAIAHVGRQRRKNIRALTLNISKTLAATLVVTSAVLSGTALAQQGQGDQKGSGMMGQGGQMGPGMMGQGGQMGPGMMGQGGQMGPGMMGQGGQMGLGMMGQGGQTGPGMMGQGMQKQK